MHIQLHNENYDPENLTRYVFFMQVSPHSTVTKPVHEGRPQE
jgi:hypothetical protein